MARDAVASGRRGRGRVRGDGGTPRRRPQTWNYLAVYGLWVVVLLLCYANFWYWRSSFDLLFHHILIRDNRNAFWWAYTMSTVLVTAVLFVVAIFSESYLRHAVEIGVGPVGRLISRFLRIGIPLAATVILSLVLNLVF